MHFPGATVLHGRARITPALLLGALVARATTAKPYVVTISRHDQSLPSDPTSHTQPAPHHTRHTEAPYGHAH